jgi:putative acetyltransferase
MHYPPVLDTSKVGEYPASAKAGGGFVWDAVLEYRVWCHPERGAPDEADGSDYYYAFETYDEADTFSRANTGTEVPLALVLQREYIDESEPGEYVHVREQRVTEWPVELLSRPQRDAMTIPEFFAADAPSNRLEILRGLAPRRCREA